jgi:phosphoribosylformimino-5-aminoimidazole carboxamide ribonucleotide (ProFAR) isomerase
MSWPDNLATIQRFQHLGFHVWTSGQIGDVHDILPMYEAGVQGVLIGRALHEGSLSYSALAHELEQAGSHITA